MICLLKKRCSARIFILLLPVLLSGCSRGPALSELQHNLQVQLDSAFGDGLWQVQHFKRYGTQPWMGNTAGERDQWVVYYHAELRLRREWRFAAWNGQGRSPLHQLLNAAERGIEGLEASGNRPGDSISVHGFALYRQGDNGWSAVPADPAVALSAAPVPAAD
ncbi:hypothetical protein ACJJIF_19735 [Microbulbifer sp. SSSA002]|uniref:hypothetical protein n=1 Tax=Microbulbifer sp. SSSA002 TaxID=3243376 RepID=UPI004039FE55